MNAPLTSERLRQARTRMEQALLARAETDATFRNRLLIEPHGAIEALFGFDPVSSLKIRVLEEGQGEAILILPRPIADDELPDDLLDYASGGGRYGPHGTVLENLCTDPNDPD